MYVPLVRHLIAKHSSISTMVLTVHTDSDCAKEASGNNDNAWFCSPKFLSVKYSGLALPLLHFIHELLVLMRRQSHLSCLLSSCGSFVPVTMWTISARSSHLPARLRFPWSSILLGSGLGVCMKASILAATQYVERSAEIVRTAL